MREILFRGKRVDNGEWIEGCLINYLPNLNPRIITCVFYDGEQHEPEYKEVNYEVLPETVGQLWIPSLGLRLFGGDLLLAECAPSGSKKVKQRKCKVIETDKGHSIAVWHKKEWYGYSHMRFTNVKVIGNIHDKQSDHEKYR